MVYVELLSCVLQKSMEYYLADHRKEELAKVYKESIEAEYRQECEFLNLMEGQKYESY